MKQPYRISVVSYLNAKPYARALHSLPTDEYHISEDVPATCAEKLLSGESDLGLIPAAVIPQIETPNFLPGYGIAARGRVDSVLLLSQVPIGKIREIVLDLESRTSVQLVRILATELWNIDPIWRDETEVSPEFNRAELESIVAIGDRALRLAKSYSYCYDLSEAWFSLTGLPFVFAAWVSPNPIPSSVVNTLQRVFETVNNPDEEFLAQLQDMHPEADVRDYLRNRIVYSFGEPELAGMRCFLQKLDSPDSKTILSVAK